MDYHSIHGHDVSSFDVSPSCHDRQLPTVSAAAAYEEIIQPSSRFVPTGIDALDAFLAPANLEDDAPAAGHGGIQKGQVTEIWGPPGVGKTAFGCQLVANALKDGGAAVWVDAFHPVCGSRLAAIAGGVPQEGSNHRPRAAGGSMKDAVHFTCPSLPHFIALLCRPLPSCIPPNTSVIVVDSLSALVNHALPRTLDSNRATAKSGTKGVPSTSARRLQLLQFIVTALQKLAAVHNAAVVVLTQCATRMQAERGATLIPALNAGIWDEGISTRLVLFRDWAWRGDNALSARFVGVQKLNGKASISPIENAVAFEVTSSGIVAANYDSNSSQRSSLPVPPTVAAAAAQKRKLSETDFEIPDSDEDGDYGWDDEDSMPPMPPQWQGSEDLILGQELVSGEDDKGKEERTADEENT